MNKILLACALAITSTFVNAEIQIKNPWVRATVPQQKATGAFMQISSTADVRLVSAQSTVSDNVEIHEMKMEGDVMKMRQVPGVDIPAGKPVELKPGAYHVMFIGLRDQVREGDVVPVRLVFEGKDHHRETVDVKAVARPLTAAPAPVR